MRLHRLAEVKAGTLAGNLSELAKGVSVYAASYIKHSFSFWKLFPKGY